MLVRQAERLDEALVWREFEPLLHLKDAPESAARLRPLLERHRG